MHITFFCKINYKIDQKSELIMKRHERNGLKRHLEVVFTFKYITDKVHPGLLWDNHIL